MSTTWITQHKQTIREVTQVRLRERETLYSEFITEASRLTLHAMSHSLQALDEPVTLYGIVGRIRLLSNTEVLREAENCCLKIVALYSEPNRTVEHFIASFDPDEHDPLEPFRTARRKELSTITTGS